MLAKTITYTDYNETSRTETFYFNFSKAELMEMELGTTGGLSEVFKKVINTHDTPSLIKIFKELVLKSYGEKSSDGRRFIKSEELSKEFSETEAYSILFMELASDADKASEFMNGIIPADMKSEVEKAVKNGEIDGINPKELEALKDLTTGQ